MIGLFVDTATQYVNGLAMVGGGGPNVPVSIVVTTQATGATPGR